MLNVRLIPSDMASFNASVTTATVDGIPPAQPMIQDDWVYAYDARHETASFQLHHSTQFDPELPGVAPNTDIFGIYIYLYHLT